MEKKMERSMWRVQMDVVSIQCSFAEVINDVLVGKEVQDKFWIKVNENRGYIFVETADDDDGQLRFREEGNSGTIFRKISDREYELTRDKVIYRLKIPFRIFSDAKILQNINTFDISSHCGFYCIGNNNGKIIIGTISDKNSILKIFQNCHFDLDVIKIQIFPSDKVLLSAGLDYTIKIWSILDGSNPRCFKGHTDRITDLKLIGKTGRNFVKKKIDKGEENLEFETENKLILSGHCSGIIALWDLGNHIKLKEFTIDSDKNGKNQVKTIVCIKEQYIIAGFEDGNLRIFDFEKQILIKDFLFSNSINSIELVKDNSAIIVAIEGIETLFEFDVNDLINNTYAITINNNNSKELHIKPKTYLVGLDNHINTIKATTSGSKLFVGAKYGEFVEYDV
ncbi:hypothetical protein PACTADRAFT_51949 [Pachysolen tannophilus NRRL Y-2460]|uniref:Anaphase-promoting complex subunit 4 WD40 domain-containing protein n=1 Tax=Pachysolen tannophilus NRRL Y-2460 TaxID=669874 RepID=A0A1E4TNU3_PACTA|nr:hypothetical protein PACTADRAFT_51949 [Pachysolen tannophilus NRRL Y-2460]